MPNIIVCALCTTRTCYDCKKEWIDESRPLGTIVKGVTV